MAGVGLDRVCADSLAIGIVVAIIRFIHCTNSEWFSFVYYLDNDNLAYGCTDSLLLTIFCWILVIATFPVLSNPQTKDRCHLWLLRHIRFSVYSRFHPVRSAVASSRQPSDSGVEI